jgi:hypothetical protein
MARKRSAKDSSQKQPKNQKASAGQSVNVVEKREKQLEIENAAADASFLKDEAARARKLALLESDKVYRAETEKIDARLLELQKTNPELFRSLFRDGGYLAAFRPDMLAGWMSEAKNEDERQIVRAFWFYTVRFQVWRSPESKNRIVTGKPGEGFRSYVNAPYRTRFRARLVNGECQMMKPEPGVEMVFVDLYEDDNPLPDPAVEEWLAGGRAMVVRLGDLKGRSVLNEIESFAYDPNAVTLIVHDSVMPYLFLLVGEMATVEEVRAAATVLTALRKRFYGRSRRGRPTNVAKLAQRIEKLKQKDGKSQKAKAFEMLDPADYRKPTDVLKSAEVKLSQTKKTIQPRPTP